MNAMPRAMKKARTRRPMSPDYYQIALQSMLDNITGKSAYFWIKTFSKRGYASVRIYVLLGRGNVIAAAVEAITEGLMRELEVFVEDCAVIVTYCEAAFWSMIRNITDVAVNDDDGDNDDGAPPR
jgi:hypothetical protein